MPLPIPSITLVPGVSQPISLANLGSIQAIKLSNGSPFNVTYSGFGVIGASILPAGVEDILYADVYNSGTLILLPKNDAGVPGNGIANIVIYQQGETLPTPKGHWPVTIPVQTVQANISTVTNLVNDGNVAGTQFAEVKVSGAPGSTWSFINDGNGSFIGVLISNVVNKLIQIANVDPLLSLGVAGHNTKVLGTFESAQSATLDTTLTVTGDATFNGAGTGLAVTNNETIGGTLVVTGDVTLNGAGTGLAVTNNETVGGTLGVTGAATLSSTLGVTGATTLSGGLTSTGGAQSLIGNGLGSSLHLGESIQGDILDVAANLTYLKSPTSINFQVPNGTNIVRIDGAGFHMVSGGVNFLNGTISHIAYGFQNNITSTVTTITHGLGTTPTAVFATFNHAAGFTTAVALYVTSVGATTFGLSSSSATAIGAYWLAIA